MQIKLTRYRNITLKRREAGEVLTVGKDVTQGQADTLIRIGGAVEIKPKGKKASPENNASSASLENK